MATMLHIVQLFAELTIETEYTLTLPTLLGSYERADAEPL